MIKKPPIGIISLGCSKNRIDTEEFLAVLIESGYEISPNIDKAEIIIINTCAFIADAREESVETILKVSEYKNNGLCKLLVVTGCLPEKDNDLLLKSYPAIDLSIGVNSYHDITKLIENSLQNKKRLAIKKKPPPLFSQMPKRFLTASPHSVNIKIAEGCNNNCSYCLIPSIRGPYRSRPIENILEEVSGFVKKGTKEINLIAQDTTNYGREIGKKPLLSLLLKELSAINGLEWIRVLYGHPAHLDDKTIELIAVNKKICSYIDLPLQHINNKILKSMRRDYTREDAICLLKKLRDNNITVRSTFIVGYPGEGYKEFNELLLFLKKYKIENIGAFKYSPEKNTPAFNLKNHVPKEIKEKRLETLMLLQKRISFKNNLKFTGNKVLTLVDERILKKDNKFFYRGRTERQAPGVDGNVVFSSDASLVPGRIIPVNIVGCGNYDLIGIHDECHRM